MRIENFMIAAWTAASSFTLLNGYKLPQFAFDARAADCSNPLVNAEVDACVDQAESATQAEIDALGPFPSLNEVCPLFEDLLVDFLACVTVCDPFICEEQAPSNLQSLAAQGCPAPSVAEICAEVESLGNTGGGVPGDGGNPGDGEDSDDGGNLAATLPIKPALAAIGIAVAGFLN